MCKFTILGPTSDSSVVTRAVFYEVVEGRVPGATYHKLSALFGRLSVLSTALTSWRFRRIILKFPALHALFRRSYAASLHRPQRVRLSGIGGAPAEGEDRYFIFCPGTNIARISTRALADLRRKCPRAHLIFYLIDGVDRLATVNDLRTEDVLAYLDHFDAVYTYDRGDAERYAERMQFIEIPVWRSPQTPAAPETDLYFCGRNKGREKLLIAIHKRLSDAGQRFKLHIVNANSAVSTHPDIMHTSWIPYGETVANVQRTNCILEILAAHNQESTLRYKEAVLYNKKLLTNNPNIAQLPYYDPRWMRTFQTADDIDLDWLHTVEPIDYGYRGDYSAETFLKRVEELTRASKSQKT